MKERQKTEKDVNQDMLMSVKFPKYPGSSKFLVKVKGLDHPPTSGCREDQICKEKFAE